MKITKKLIIVIVFLPVLLFVIYKSSQNITPSDSMMNKDDALMEPTDALMQLNDSDTSGEKMMKDKMEGSRYVEYSSMSTLENYSGNRRVLFFYASWCPTCKVAEESFSKNIYKIPEDITVIRVNYNDSDTDQEEKDLAKKYGITYQHTFVQIDSSGKEITKWNGGQLDELLSNIK